MANLTITATAPEIENALQGALRLERLRNPTPLYKAWAQYLEKLAVQAFKTETAPFGSAWDPLRPITRALDKGPPARPRKGILRASGTLYDTVVGQVLPDGAQVGTNQKVGAYSLGAIHQFGAVVPITPKSRGYFRHQFRSTNNDGWQKLSNAKNDFVVIPARPFLPMDDQGNILPDAVEELTALTRDYILG